MCLQGSGTVLITDDEHELWKKGYQKQYHWDTIATNGTLFSRVIKEYP